MSSKTVSAPSLSTAKKIKLAIPTMPDCVTECLLACSSIALIDHVEDFLILDDSSIKGQLAQFA
jgi:hypothetical protein